MFTAKIKFVKFVIFSLKYVEQFGRKKIIVRLLFQIPIVTLTLYSANVITVPRRTTWRWYTGRWRVGCNIWYSEEGTGRTNCVVFIIVVIECTRRYVENGCAAVAVTSLWRYVMRIQLLVMPEIKVTRLSHKIDVFYRFFFISFVKRNRTRKDRRLCLQQLVTTNEADRISLQLKLDCTQRAQSSAKDKISTKIDSGFESGLVRIRIRLSAGSLPKCCVISPSVVKLGRRLSEKRW